MTTPTPPNSHGTDVARQGARDTTAQAWLVDGSATTQPVSVSSLPLPAGAALDSTLSSIAASLNDLALAAILESERQAIGL